jgi:hypothetical protein
VGYKNPELQRAYQLTWLRKRREAWLKGNGPCVDCGSWGNLEVDHVDASTKVSHRVWSWSLARRTSELSKCVVRCKQCHARKTTLAKEYKILQGEANGNAKLTDEKVTHIRALYKNGWSFTELARLTNLDSWTISKACRGVTWKHLPVS